VTCATKFLFRRVAEGGVTFQNFCRAAGAVGLFFRKYIYIEIEAAISGGRHEKIDFSFKLFQKAHLCIFLTYLGVVLLTAQPGAAGRQGEPLFWAS
jgi:hypothetical protein